jgi:hypothetical protein
VLPVAFAAVEAVERPGTEVAPADAPERPGGLRAAAALLRHRRRTQLPAPDAARATAA